MPGSPSFTPSVLPSRDSLQGAACALVARGWTLRWDVADCCGEPDVRLVVCGRPAASVEVLVPGPDDGWWDAVRVRPASRVIWRGPEVGCPCDTLVRFVEDLLTRDVEQLPGRYQLLG